MKKITKRAIVLGAIVGIATGLGTQAQAFSNPFKKVLSDEYISEKLLSTLDKHGASTLCRKGDASKGIFSFRSFEGVGANFEIIALTGMLLCYEGNLDNFQNSGFAGIAVNKLKTKDMDVIRTRFTQKIGSAKGKVLSLGCKAGAAAAVASGVAFAGPAVGMACSAILPKSTQNKITATSNDAVPKESSTSYRDMKKATAAPAA